MIAAVDQQFAAHHVRQQLGDGQTQTGTRRGANALAVAALERLEDAFHVGLRYADAGIGHVEFGDAAAIPHAPRDRT
jgi:hypothetical protein